jgi:hypothetical protein
VTGILVALLFLARQQAPQVPDSGRVARDVVARFYAWYAPAAQKTPETDMRALRDRRWHFSPALVSALRADRAASRASHDEIVGLDMDPFLNSQDPCEHYSPTAVRRAGNTFLVDVLGTGGCGRHVGPDVTVRVAFQGSTPVFVDFIYPSPANDSLSGVLAQLAADRAKKPHH